MLRKDGMEIENVNLKNPSKTPQASYVEQSFAHENIPAVALPITCVLTQNKFALL